jgi:hypothetical protein
MNNDAPPMHITALRPLVHGRKRAPATNRVATNHLPAGVGGVDPIHGGGDSAGHGHPILSFGAQHNSRFYRNRLSGIDKMRHATNAQAHHPNANTQAHHHPDVINIDDEAVDDTGAAEHFHHHQWNTPHDSAAIFQQEKDDLALALALSTEELMTGGVSPMEPTQLDMHQGEGIGRAHSFGGSESAAAAALLRPAAAAAAPLPRPAMAASIFAPSPATARLGRARQLHYNNQPPADAEDDGQYDDVYDALGQVGEYSGLVHDMARDSLASGQLTQEFYNTTNVFIQRRRNKKRSKSCP